MLNNLFRIMNLRETVTKLSIIKYNTAHKLLYNANASTTLGFKHENMKIKTLVKLK